MDSPYLTIIKLNWAGVETYECSPLITYYCNLFCACFQSVSHEPVTVLSYPRRFFLSARNPREYPLIPDSNCLHKLVAMTSAEICLDFFTAPSPLLCWSRWCTPVIRWAHAWHYTSLIGLRLDGSRGGSIEVFILDQNRFPLPVSVGTYNWRFPVLLGDENFSLSGHLLFFKKRVGIYADEWC